MMRPPHCAATEQSQHRRLKDLHAQGHSSNQQLALEGMPAGIVSADPSDYGSLTEGVGSEIMTFNGRLLRRRIVS